MGIRAPREPKQRPRKPRRARVWSGRQQQRVSPFLLPKKKPVGELWLNPDHEKMYAALSRCKTARLAEREGTDPPTSPNLSPLSADTCTTPSRSTRRRPSTAVRPGWNASWRSASAIELSCTMDRVAICCRLPTRDARIRFCRTGAAVRMR